MKQVDILWFKNRDGRYTLTGIRITEDGSVRESTGTFSGSDARWLTEQLDAAPIVDVERAADYPTWGPDYQGQDRP